MNAIDLFEQSAKREYLSHQPVQDRAKRLRILSDAIERFAQRLAASHRPADDKPSSRWDEAARDRTVRYLERLASDVRYLAFAAERGA